MSEGNRPPQFVYLTRDQTASGEEYFLVHKNLENLTSAVGHENGLAVYVYELKAVKRLEVKTTLREE